MRHPRWRRVAKVRVASLLFGVRCWRCFPPLLVLVCAFQRRMDWRTISPKPSRSCLTKRKTLLAPKFLPPSRPSTSSWTQLRSSNPSGGQQSNRKQLTFPHTTESQACKSWSFVAFPADLYLPMNWAKENMGLPFRVSTTIPTSSE